MSKALHPDKRLVRDAVLKTAKRIQSEGHNLFNGHFQIENGSATLTFTDGGNIFTATYVVGYNMYSFKFNKTDLAQ